MGALSGYRAEIETYPEARLAQSVERTTFNRVVVGSSPTSGADINRADSLVA